MNCADNAQMTVTPIEPCPACDAEPALIEVRLHDVPNDHVCTITPEEARGMFPQLMGQHVDHEP